MAEEIFNIYTLILRINLLRRLQIISKAHELRFRKDFFDGGREGREGDKLSAILNTNIQTIEPESLHTNADLMTKPTKLHKQFNFQRYQVSKPRCLLLLSGVPEDSLRSGMPSDANQFSLLLAGVGLKHTPSPLLWLSLPFLVPSWMVPNSTHKLGGQRV